ncbi:hypothetical protein ACMFMG_012025 [Clarireedia jacksonii]
MTSALISSMSALSLDAPSVQTTPQNLNTAVRNNKPKAKKHNKYRSNSHIPHVSLQSDASLSAIEVSNNASPPQQQQHNLPRNSKPRHPVAVKPWAMFANLHDNVQNLLNESNLNFTFCNIDNESNILENRNTNIMGRFKCTNKRCSKRWFSSVVPITIRYYANRQYNARVYKQRCKRCDSLGEIQPDDSYAERVVYWLKTWSGVPMERIIYSHAPTKGPHEKSLDRTDYWLREWWRTKILEDDIVLDEDTSCI